MSDRDIGYLILFLLFAFLLSACASETGEAAQWVTRVCEETIIEPDKDYVCYSESSCLVCVEVE